MERERLRLQITPDKLEGVYPKLGPEGLGSFVVRQTLDQGQLAYLQEEIDDPTRVIWRDNHAQDYNQRGKLIIENHDAFVLKLSLGDQAPVDRVPRMYALAQNLEAFFQDELSVYFPALRKWQLDEMSLHRYDDQEVGLSTHRDNRRFYAVVGVLVTEGEKDAVIEYPEGTFLHDPVYPGDLILNRVNGLYEHPKIDEAGEPVNICPEHGSYNMRTPTSTSFIVRANTMPRFATDGFEYYNWVGEPLQPRRV